MSWAGYQIQRGLQVPTCYPGMVFIEGSSFVPPAKKWNGVVLNDGDIEFSEHDLVHETRGIMPVTDRLKKWAVKPDRERFSHDSGKPTAWRACLAGVGVSGASPKVVKLNDYNRFTAVAGRVFREKPDAPRRGECWDKAWELIDELLPELQGQRMTDDAWLASMPARRRRPLKQAMERLHEKGWSDAYAKFGAFLKTQMEPDFGQNADLAQLTPHEGGVARLIQGPRDETHCIAGPYIKPLLANLKKQWDVDSPIFYGSSTPEKLDQFLNDRLMKHQLIGTCDFSMFDCTYTDEAWAFMHKLYRRALIDDPLFWKVMAVWQKPVGRCGPFRYRAPVVNASGRDDTAIANAILNGIATSLSIASALLNKPVFELVAADLQRVRADYCLSVVGDDSIFGLPLMEEKELKRFEEAFNQNIRLFGFCAKLQTSYDPFDAVYLGMRPYPNDGRWAWGKTIGRCVYRLGWALWEPGRDMMAHITGISQMHVLCSRQVPVVWDLCHRVAELRVGCRSTPVEWREHVPWDFTREVAVGYDRETMAYVARGYGVPLDGEGSLCELLDQIRAIQRLPCVLRHPVLEAMVAHDEL